MRCVVLQLRISDAVLPAPMMSCGDAMASSAAGGAVDVLLDVVDTLVEFETALKAAPHHHHHHHHHWSTSLHMADFDAADAIGHQATPLHHAPDDEPPGESSSFVCLLFFFLCGCGPILRRFSWKRTKKNNRSRRW